MGGGQAVVTLNSAGASTHSLTVGPGTMVMFQNLDSVPHQIASGSGCSELNGPMLAAGASFTAMMAATAETCEFHDGLNPTNASFEGTIMVSMPMMMGRS
jgi:plastocyanin